MDALDLLNGIRAEAGTEYTTRIPEATRTNIAAVGNAILEYTAGKEYFFNTLINKITETIFHLEDTDDKFAVFKGQLMEYGDTIEDIFMDLITGENFGEPVDGESIDQYKVTKSTIKTEYHTIDRKRMYPLTVSDVAVRSAFRSAEGVQNLVQGMIDTIEQSVAYDNYIMGKELLASNYTAGNFAVQAITTIAEDNIATAGKELMKAIKVGSNDMTYKSTKFNKRGYLTSCKTADQILFVNKDIKAKLESDLYSNLFNFEKVVPNLTTIELDDFGTAEGVYAILIDKKAIVIRDSLNQLESVRNAKGLYTNYFKHVWGVGSIRQFKNAIAFVDTATIVPEEPVVPEGE